MWLLWTIIIGILAGFLAGKIVKGHGMGTLMDLLIGIVGSVLGGWIFTLLGTRRVRPDRPARDGNSRRSRSAVDRKSHQEIIAIKFRPPPSSQTAPVAQALLPVRRYLRQTHNNSSQGNNRYRLPPSALSYMHPTLQNSSTSA